MFEDEYIQNQVYEPDFDTPLIISQYYPIYLQNVVQLIFVDIKFQGQPCKIEKYIKTCFIAVRKI